jgi:hypothetical protein
LEKNQEKDLLCLIEKYKITQDNKEKNILRNEIYKVLEEFIPKWVGAICSEQNVFFEKNELTSIGWDCFIFSLDKFSPENNIPVLSHFYKYSRYCIMLYLHKERKKEDIEVELTINNEVRDNGEMPQFSADMEWFRSTLPDNYKIIFDDAVCSMAPGKLTRIRRIKTSGMTYLRYCEAKKIFKHIIGYLSGRPSTDDFLGIEKVIVIMDVDNKSN